MTWQTQQPEWQPSGPTSGNWLQRHKPASIVIGIMLVLWVAASIANALAPRDSGDQPATLDAGAPSPPAAVAVPITAVPTTSTKSTAHAKASGRPTSVTTTSATPSRLPKTVCSAFSNFYAKLSRTSPMGHQVQLVASVEVVGTVADRDPQAISRRLFDDVQNLEAYVGATAFPFTGNIEGRPVQSMVSDCFH